MRPFPQTVFSDPTPADTNTAEAAQRSGLGGIDAYVAGSLYTPQGLPKRDKRMPQLARGYGMWVVQSCFAGPGSDYPEAVGGSALWAPDGTVAARADERPDRIVKAEPRF